MAANNDTLALSALVDLIRRGVIRDLSTESQQRALAHVQQYLAGRVRFPLMTEAEAEIAIAPYMPQQLEGLGSFLKKAVKDVGNAVTKVVKVAAPLAMPLILGTNLIPIATTILGAQNPGATVAGAMGVMTGNPNQIMQSVAMFAQALSAPKQQEQAVMQQKAAAGERAAVLDQNAQALVARIGRNPFEPAGQALVANYRAKLEATTDQASLDRIVAEIITEQDRAGLYATPNGTTNAVDQLPDDEKIMKYLPWLAAGGLALMLLNRPRASE